MASREFIIRYTVVEKDADPTTVVGGTQTLELDDIEGDTTTADILAEVEEAIVNQVFGESS